MAAPTPSDLGALMGRDVDAGQAASVLAIITSMAKSYTRGVGFVNGVPNDEIKHGAILPASARLLAHPRMLPMSETLGPQQVDYRAGFTGFSVQERITLDRYRKRAL